MMKVFFCVVPAGLLMLAGCNFRNGMPQVGTTASQAAPGNAASVQPAAPYSLTAQCTGPYISFNLANQGPTPLAIKREHFALVEPSSRKVSPYTQHTATIDIQETELAPGESIQGRAWFKEYPVPTGNRLVYKPDAIGTYAEVAGPPGV